ncbi:MAG: hypothetical protein ABS87_00025 [Sphingomonas sp. SCN 67-18]|uniref:serine/threonine-protein kinase n=1 Tax=uncultured Sphingomonas sp. TaxID=158754 RepID=UPI00086CAE3E|nr:serine/threonine-protein kinase [Sphingomonas sp. SCN 67-18]ODU23001.1 MAG: hypothetical protein ABS87_00025 [Sphingomonas sp. SCN 67-18]
MTGGGSIEWQVLRLLDDALERSPDEREAWIVSHAPDETVRDRALSLLRAGAGETGFRTGLGARHVDDGPVPERIGAYRITGVIGQGGMGTVYHGERDSGDFDLSVAIKLIRPGVLTDALVDRFRRERQTLASLSHPFIARLFDGGDTVEGQPYIVMELVDGVPLDRWIRDHGPDIATRLKLFIDICSAVAFAHQNLVVHRDITPSNVLVTAQGVAKLIDFGIARPQEPHDGLPVTSPGSLADLSLTPGFAAPERMAGAAATTLSDIYSLGRLLQLMTADGAAPDADRDAIIAQATAADPTERYQTAAALAEDVARLSTGHPVTARRGGRRYLAGKFVRRHRAGVIAGVAALVLLLAALAAISWSYVRAEQARAAEVKRFNEVRQLANYLLFDLNDRLERVPGNTAARASLAQQAQTYLDGLALARGDDDALRMETALGLIRLAEIQGTPAERNLGLFDEARRNLVRAEASLIALRGTRGATPEIAAALATARGHRSMIALQADKDVAAAELLARSALGTLAAVPEARRDTGWHQARRVIRHAQLDFYDLRFDADRLEALTRRLEADIAEWPEPMRGSPDAAVERAFATYYRGLVSDIRESGDYGQASFESAFAQLAALEAADINNPDLLYMMGWSANLAFGAASRNGDNAAAARMIEAAQRTMARLRVIDDRDDSVYVLVRNTDDSWSQHLANIGRYPEAIAIQQALIAQEKARTAREGQGLGVGLAFNEMMLGATARKAGDRAMACDNWRLAEARFAQVAGSGKLLEFYAAYLPGLRRNLARCDAGEPLSTFTDLR